MCVWRVFVYLASLSNVHTYRGARYKSIHSSRHQWGGDQRGGQTTWPPPPSPAARLQHTQDPGDTCTRARDHSELPPALLSAEPRPSLHPLSFLWSTRSLQLCWTALQTTVVSPRYALHNSQYCPLSEWISSAKARGGVSRCEDAQEWASVRPKTFAPPRARPDSPTAGALAAGSRSARGRAGPSWRQCGGLSWPSCVCVLKLFV